MQILLLLLIENREKRKFYVIDFVSNMASDHTSAGKFMLEAVHVHNDNCRYPLSKWWISQRFKNRFGDLV